MNTPTRFTVVAIVGLFVLADGASLAGPFTHASNPAEA